MEAIDIPTLMRSTADSLETDGLVPPGRIRIGAVPSSPAVLYGDPDGIRNLLLLVLVSAEEPDSGGPVEFSAAYEREPDGLRIVFTVRAARFGFGADEPGRLYEGISCTRRSAQERIGTGTVDLEVLRCSIPVRTANETAPFRSSDGGPGHDPPFSFEAIAGELQDRSAARNIVTEYLEYLDEQFTRLRDAIARGDAVSVHREAHSIKGGAMNIRAERLQRLARTLELEASSGRLENAREMLENMKEARRELVTYLATLPEGNGP